MITINVEETYQRIMNGEEKEALYAFRRLYDYGLDTFIKHILTLPTENIYNFFLRIENISYSYDKDKLYNIIVTSNPNIVLYIMFYGIVDNTTHKSQILTNLIVEELIKSENKEEIYKLMAIALKPEDYQSLIESCKARNFNLVNKRVIDAINQTTRANKDRLALEVVLNYELPSEDIYNYLKNYITTHDNLDTLTIRNILKSINVPFDTLFTYLKNHNLIYEFCGDYQSWHEENDYKAFLFEEFIHENNITDIPIYPRRGMLANILLTGNLSNYYKILNYWRMEINDKKDFLRVYTRTNIFACLEDYAHEGLEIDQKYLEFADLKRDSKLENNKQR